VIGDEPRLAYNRVLLLSVLARETAPEDIELMPMSCGASGRYLEGRLPGNRDRWRLP
jgi:hypothetical protein